MISRLRGIVVEIDGDYDGTGTVCMNGYFLQLNSASYALR